MTDAPHQRERLGSGFHTNPIAERCGCRLINTYPALATRLGESGSNMLNRRTSTAPTVKYSALSAANSATPQMRRGAPAVTGRGDGVASTR